MSGAHLTDVAMQFGILLFSLCLHEYGHAFMADRLGDPTPRMLGRLTLDPRAHADPIGTVFLPLLRLVYPSLLVFGWAKPVPITPENFKNPRRDGAWVALAGPLANLFLCLASLVFLFVLGVTNFLGVEESLATVLQTFFKSFFWVNFALAIFNLIPVYPLDGSWILKAFLPGRWAYSFSRFDRFGAILLLVGFYMGWLKYLFMPLMMGFYLLLSLVGLENLASMIYTD